MKDWYFSPLEDSINFPQNTFFIINKKELSDNDLKNNYLWEDPINHPLVSLKDLKNFCKKHTNFFFWNNDLEYYFENDKKVLKYIKGINIPIKFTNQEKLKSIEEIANKYDEDWSKEIIEIINLNKLKSIEEIANKYDEDWSKEIIEIIRR